MRTEDHVASLRNGRDLTHWAHMHGTMAACSYPLEDYNPNTSGDCDMAFQVSPQPDGTWTAQKENIPEGVWITISEGHTSKAEAINACTGELAYRLAQEL